MDSSVSSGAVVICQWPWFYSLQPFQAVFLGSVWGAMYLLLISGLLYVLCIKPILLCAEGSLATAKGLQ